MRMRKETFLSRGFTRLELMTIVGVIVLSGLVVLPGVANTRTRYARLECLNNLRQIGVAFHVWGNDHQGNLPPRVPVSEGGVMAYPGAGYAWVNFRSLSNELATPRLLACPDDSAKTPAPTWADLQRLSYPNAAVSYFVGPDAYPHRPLSIASGDRGLAGDGIGNCSAGIAGLFLVNYNPIQRAAWTNREVHALAGNLLLADGRVLETTTATLRWRLQEGGGHPIGSLHFVMP